MHGRSWLAHMATGVPSHANETTVLPVPDLCMRCFSPWSSRSISHKNYASLRYSDATDTMMRITCLQPIRYHSL